VKGTLKISIIILSLVTIVMAKQGPLGLEAISAHYPEINQNYHWNSFQRGHYLIVGTDAVIASPYLGLFKQAKERQGFVVTMASLTQTGQSSTSIKNYIADYYTNNPLEYVLLIGDVTGAFALPSFTYGPENDVSDLPYVLIEGDDYFPEAIIGRWPVDTQNELARVINKTLIYSENPNTTSGYLDRTVIVAGNYADTGTILTPVWTSRWLRDRLNNFGYSQIDTVFFPPIVSPNQIQAAFNNGVGIANYRGWGDSHGWHYPQFHISDFDEGQLTNGTMLPIVFSFVCGTGKFDSPVDPAFCEALLTSGTLSIPSGAVAVIAPSDLHTRTKYNNALNSGMWDELLEGRASELGPALLASKISFMSEYTDELDPGEMAEFYFHTYNIIGDPSLPVWLKTPDIMPVTLSDFGAPSKDDGLIRLQVSAIPKGVFSLIQDGLLVGSGRWENSDIRIYRFDGKPFGETSNTNLSITLNAQGFLPQSFDIVLATGSGFQFAGLANQMVAGQGTWTPQFKNVSNTTVNFDVTITSGEDYSQSFLVNAVSNNGVPISGPELSMPNISWEDRELLLDITINGETLEYGVPLSIVQSSMSVLADAMGLLPNANFSLNLDGLISGYLSNTVFNFEIRGLADYATFSDNTASATLINEAFTFTDDVFSGSLGNVSSGSTLPVEIDVFVAGSTNPCFIVRQTLLIGSIETSDPTPPCDYGYWAYDNFDIAYPGLAPVYDWIELAENSSATHHILSDDDHIFFDLPFDFNYFGDMDNRLTICSNGWVAFGEYNIDFFRNWSIPGPLGPDAMIAPFWDDLDYPEGGQIDIYTMYDETKHALIIEYYNVPNGFGDNTSIETFQILLYDPNYVVAQDGTGIIEFQYAAVEDVDATNNYTTVGIESPDQNDGVQYVHNRHYAPGATPLQAGLAIRFTTDEPENYQTSIDEKIGTSGTFTLGSAYPNPFNRSVVLPIHIYEGGIGELKIYNLKGQVVHELSNISLLPGQREIHLNHFDFASGIYLITLEISGEHQMQKITFLK
jgi:hypothetical protein